MSDHGFRFKLADGTVIFDTREAQGGVIIAVEALSSASATVKTYPAFAEFDVFVLDGFGAMPTAAVVDDALGYPRVTYPAGSTLRTDVYIVFGS